MFTTAFTVVRTTAFAFMTLGLAIGPLVAEARPAEPVRATVTTLAQAQTAPRPTVRITPRPDLVITRVTTTELGDCQRHVKVTIKNNPTIGRLGAKVGSFQVALVSSGKARDLETISGLDVGQSKTVTLFGSGERTEWVSVDWGNKQKESREDNNNSKKFLVVC
jgi:hypothetical protein